LYVYLPTEIKNHLFLDIRLHEIFFVFDVRNSLCLSKHFTYLCSFKCASDLKFKYMSPHRKQFKFENLHDGA